MIANDNFKMIMKEQVLEYMLCLPHKHNRPVIVFLQILDAFSCPMTWGMALNGH
jgi:hypothetical protein